MLVILHGHFLYENTCVGLLSSSPELEYDTVFTNSAEFRGTSPNGAKLLTYSAPLHFFTHYSLAMSKLYLGTNVPIRPEFRKRNP